MELKVMLLDDEFIILDGLRSFPWQEYGCRVTEIARNGIEGLEKMKKDPPDLILTDIRMPGMDGLEFAARAKELDPEVTIVILTGYDVFDYARNAISIGVDEYLLKPIDYEIMRDTILRISGEIRARAKQQQYWQKLKAHFERGKPMLRARFTSNLLQGRVQSADNLRALEDSLQISIDKYIVCVARKLAEPGCMNRCDGWIEELGFIRIFENKYEENRIRVLSDYNTASMEYNFILLFAGDVPDAECMRLAENACYNIREEIRRYGSEAINFGLSDVGQNAFIMNGYYRKAQIANNQSLYLGMNMILKYEDLHLGGCPETRFTEGIRSHFMMTLQQGSLEKVEEELCQMFDTAGGRLSDRKLAAMDLLLASIRYPYMNAAEQVTQNENHMIAILRDGVKRISDCDSTDALVQCLCTSMSALMKQNVQSADDRNRRLAESVKAYIDKKYAEDLSMDDLANRFHISRSYLSRILKKYAGQSFLEYLTDVRFLNAEMLLTETSLKQYEIAERVGFRDFGYYIKAFKKRYGITPNEYRKQI